ncbi:uncharacterized protein PV09_07158 [Verruconis gallopava]|uniref:CUE domain-containing protein n=1 Tax=Verruconis gallopava TaxID=253628 RepID=A0A0D1XGQ9_9PEZI|nr:uncharacterized protein PV09_07158 [Verruconis gallopava]KIW01391.1 hypothetical protein PV09_07158 [Verruconis gallopava]
MTDPEKHSGAESPTTGREPDFDDDPPQDGNSSVQPDHVASPTPKEPKKVSFSEEEAPPAKPPRPMSPRAQAEATLIEAFPSIDLKVIKAVLTASGGQVEPAFNALLGMSDPTFEPEQPPPQPARPQRRQQPMSQLEADELYARQLAEQYDNAAGEYGPRGRGRPPPGARRQRPNELHENEYSFWDDDLPEIKKNLTKGFQETQKTVNKWISEFKRRLDGDDEDDEHIQQGQSSGQFRRQNFGPSQSEQLRGINRMSAQGRRSGDRERYDADPQVLSDDFRELQMEDNETPPRRPPRPQANPNLFKPTPAVPTGPVDEVDALYSQPSPPQGKGPTSGATSGGKKWQPLTSVAPAPVGEDNDPFSLGDSDEEEAKKTDLKPEDSERLKKSASKSESSKPDVQPEEAGKEGTKNKEAEELLNASGQKK